MSHFVTENVLLTTYITYIIKIVIDVSDKRYEQVVINFTYFFDSNRYRPNKCQIQMRRNVCFSELGLFVS